MYNSHLFNCSFLKGPNLEGQLGSWGWLWAVDQFPTEETGTSLLTVNMLTELQLLQCQPLVDTQVQRPQLGIRENTRTLSMR